MTLSRSHQPKYQPYKERDRLLAFLLDEDAKNQRIADILDVLAAEVRGQAIRIGQMVDPPLPTPLNAHEKDAPPMQRKSA